MSTATESRVQRKRRPSPNSDALGNSDAAQPIIERLQSVLRRIKRVILLRGDLGVAATVVATVLILMGIDTFVVIESTLLRALASLAGLSAVAASVWWFVVRPLRRRLSLTTVARMVEEHHPELQERVSSAFELLSAPMDARGSRGSEQLIAALAAEASVDVRSFDPRREVGTRSLRPYVITACALTSIFLLVVALWPRETANLLLRLVAPGRNMDRVQALSLEVEPHEDVVVSLGSPLTISVRAANGRLMHPQLRHIDSTGREVKEAMQAGASDGAFAQRYDAVLESFQFRIEEGAAITRVYRVTAVERPRIERVSVRYEYPSYTELASHTEANVTRPIVGPLGTRLTISAIGDRAITKPTMHIGNDALEGQTDAAQKLPAYSWPMTLAKDISQFTLVLEDSQGVKSEPKVVEFHGLADRPPQVQITDPTKDKIRLKPTDYVNLHYAADDDFGFSAAELLVSIDGAAATVLPMPLPMTDTPAMAYLAPEGRLWKGVARLELHRLDLTKAQRVTVRIKVQDNRPAPAGAQVALSPPLEITLDQTAQDYAVQKVEQQVDDFKGKVEEILAGVKAAQPVAHEVTEKAGTPGKLDEPTQGKIEKVTTAAHEAATKLEAVVKTFEGTLLEPLTPALAEVADQPLPQTEKEIEQAGLQDDPGKRQEHSGAAENKLAKAVTKLEAVLKELPQHRQKLTDLAQIEALDFKQQQIVKDINQDTEQPPSPAEPQPWRENEADVLPSWSSASRRILMLNSPPARTPIPNRRGIKSPAIRNLAIRNPVTSSPARSHRTA